MQLNSSEETEDFAAKLATICNIGDCILLYGDVGVGKTTFARGFIKALTGISEEIVSPTFTLVQTYPMPNASAVWHCDLYRLKHASELIELGLDDAFAHGITLIEWPEIAASELPKYSLKVTLEIRGQGRMIRLEGEGWDDRLKAL